MKKTLIVSLLMMVAMVVHAFDYSQVKRGEFAQKTVAGVRPMADGDHYTTLETGGRVCKYAYKSGEQTAVLFDASAHEAIGNVMDYEISADGRKIMLVTDKKPIYRHSYTAKHWVWDSQTNKLTPLTEEGGEQVATFAPQSDRVAFVRDNNIYMVSLADMSLRQITHDGEFNHVINGHTDWVYEEEFGYTRAFEFSPDGSKIVFLRSDESRVPQFTMMRHFGEASYPTPYVFKYPKAGEENSVVSVWVYDSASGKTQSVDCGDDLYYVPRLGWTPNGEVYVYKTNRLQNHFDLVVAGADYKGRVVYSERNPKYIERLTTETVTFLPDGDRFVVKNETSGFMHLYLYSMKDGLIRALTGGEWEVVDLISVVDDRVYYYSKEQSPLGRELYCVDLDGKNKKRMTSKNGTYTIAPSAGFKYYIQYFSDLNTPNTVTLHRRDGRMVRVLENNDKLKSRLAKGDVPKRAFFSMTTEHGDLLNGYVVRPVNFDSTVRYPVLMYQYSGPGSQQVEDRWGVDWTDLLTEKGYLVVCVDGRGTGGRGEEFRKCTYGQLGRYETEDQIAVAKWLAQQSWVEPSRIGIYGWSFGGFMTLNCMLKGNDLFKMGVAVAPVTSWRWYDTIYTELYNGLPQDNAAGYDDNSPVNFADQLKGKLLIVHGTDDDNVHIQNSYAMISALVSAGKQFDVAIYPENNHSMRPNGAHHVRERMIEYVVNNL